MHADRYIFSKTSLLWSLPTPADLCSLLHWSLCNDSALTILVFTLLLISPYMLQSLHWEHIPDTSCVNPNIQQDHQTHSVLTLMPLITPYLFCSPPPLRTYTNTSRLKLKKPTESWGSVFSVHINTENKSLSVLTMMPPFFSYSFLMSPYLFWFLLWEMLSNTSCVKPKKPSEPWGYTFTDMSCIDPKSQQAFHCPYRSHSIITMMFPYCHTLTTPYLFWYLLWELIPDTSCLKPKTSQ